ncbi:hypothetical protein UlMin_004802 [Ulmus minor]
MVDKLTEAKLHVVCGAIELIQHNYNTFIHKNPCTNSSQTGNKWLREVLDGNDDRSNYRLQGSRRTNVIEIIGMFLHILGHGVFAQERFQHSAWTDCIGTIDGVHVQACITSQNQVPFIGKKGTPTQNIMDVCKFDMQFIDALAGWEGNAHDAQIFLSALRDPNANFPKPLEGPYKNERYYLQVFRQSGQLEGYKEVFNHAHSSLRSVIECTFGIWKKKKWKILRDMSSYSFEKQIKIVIVTMTLHNYIRRHNDHDRHFAKSPIIMEELKIIRILNLILPVSQYH